MDKFDLEFPHLGKGAYGVCHKASNKFDGIKGCLKVYDHVTSAKMKKYFENEFLMMSQVNHYNIIKPYEGFWQDDRFCIFMELASKGSLQQFCKSPQKEKNIVQWARQIARGLAIIHGKHIMHRDLKPENILITNDNVLKIADFGISRKLDKELVTAMTFAGTRPYIAPELYLHQPAGFPSDIFSFGVILYQLASGKLPFTGIKAKDYKKSVCSSIPSPLPSTLSKELTDLIFQMLEKNPKQRITLGEILLNPLINLGSSPEAEQLLTSHSFHPSKLEVLEYSPKFYSSASDILLLHEAQKPSLLQFSTPKKSPLSFSKETSLHRNSVNGKTQQDLISEISKVDLIPIREAIDKYEHYIFVSKNEDIDSFDLKTDAAKSVFIVIEDNISEIFCSKDQRNQVLKSVLILPPIKILGEKTFYFHKSLSSIKIPNTVTHIGLHCFCSCLSLKSIDLPSSLEELGMNCFWNCTSLQSITLPPSLKVLNCRCFCGCSNLFYIFIPKSVITIWSSSFCKCTKLFETVHGEKPRIEIEDGSKFTLEILYGCQDPGYGEAITK